MITLFRNSGDRRIPSLDGLRAFSIALVVLGHAIVVQGVRKTHVTEMLVLYSHYGVQVFFVISGFLITTLLLKEHAGTGEIDIPSFYRRRTVRIFPAAYFYIAMIALAIHPAPRYVGYALAYLMSYVFNGVPWVFRHLWSLSVEEQFYLLWPMALAFGGFRYRRHIAWGVMLCVPILRLLAWKHGWQDIEFYFPTVADSIAAGCLLALYQGELEKHFAWLTQPVPAVVLAGFTLVLPILFRPVGAQIFLEGLVPLSIALCLFVAVRRKDWFLNNPFVCGIGVMSYSLYLWQQPFFDNARHVVWTSFPLNLLLTFACAYASYRWIEQPALLFRTKSKGMKKTEGISVPVAASPR